MALSDRKSPSAIINTHLKLTGLQTEILDRVISGLLPHTNYNAEDAVVLYAALYKILPIHETYGFYYTVYLALENIAAVKNTYTDTIVLTKETYELALQISFGSLLRRPEFNADLFFKQAGIAYGQEGLEFEQSVDAGYSYCCDRFDEIFELAVPTGEAVTLVESLRASLKVSVFERCLNIQAETLHGSVVWNGKTYSGPNDAVNLSSIHLNELEQRFADTNKITSRQLLGVNYDAHLRLHRENQLPILPLLSYGYAPVDDVLQICTQDIVCVIADEGVGKTKLTLDWAHEAIVNGKNVLVICGETDIVKYEIFMMLNHIHYKTGNSISYAEYTNRELLPHNSEEELENWNVMIAECCCDFYDNPNYGLLILQQNIEYENFGKFVSDCAERHNTQIVVVDHVAALLANGAYTLKGYLRNDKDRIDWLYTQEDILTKEYNIAFINTVHTQNDVSRDLSKGKEVGVRIAGGSSATTKYGTVVWLLRTNDELEKQSLLILQNKKSRDTAKPPTILLIRDGRTNRHTFNPKIQHLLGGATEDISTKRLDTLIGREETYEEEDDIEDIGDGLG